jgi:hypothetical protein
MRIKILQKPTIADIEGVRLDLFEPGAYYEVGNRLGALFLAEGWAVPVNSDEPALLVPMSDIKDDREPGADPSNLQREFSPPYYEGAPALLAERRRHRRDKIGR